MPAALASAYEVPAAFLDPAADLLVVSSDDVSFKVFRGLLIAGSAVFRNMFFHPGPPAQYGREAPLKWPEPAATITTVLYQLYPIVRPEVATVEELLVVAMAADKWEMDGVMAKVQVELLKPDYFDQRPLAIYRLACRLDDAHLICVTSQRLVELHDPLDSTLDDDLDDLSAREFVTLCKLRKARVEYCLELYEGLVPSRCPCGYKVEYGPWKDSLHAELIKRPAGTSIPHYLHLVSNLGCDFGPCYGHADWLEDGLRNLWTTLQDRSRFTSSPGIEPSLLSAPTPGPPVF